MSPLRDKYSETLDRESAYEIITEQRAEEEAEKAEAEAKAQAEKEAAAKAKEEEKKAKEEAKAKAEKEKAKAKKKKSSVLSKAASSTANTIGRELGKSIIRGIFGTWKR